MTADDELLEKLEHSTRNATRHQTETLKILERHGGVRYLQRHLRGYDAPLDAATFRRVVPLSTYGDYSDDINRLADVLLDNDHDHDRPLLSVDSLLCFFYSAGTSSLNPKLIPHFDSSLSKAALYMAHQGSSAILRRLFPARTSANNKIILFVNGDNVTNTKGDFEVVAASSYPLRSCNANRSKLTSISSPKEVILRSHVEHQMYCHLLCGLRISEFIDGIIGPFAVGLIKELSLVESK